MGHSRGPICKHQILGLCFQNWVLQSSSHRSIHRNLGQTAVQQHLWSLQAKRLKENCRDPISICSSPMAMVPSVSFSWHLSFPEELSSLPHFISLLNAVLLRRHGLSSPSSQITTFVFLILFFHNQRRFHKKCNLFKR